MPDIIAERSIDLDGTLQACEEHRGLVRGIKARMVSPALEIFGMEMPRLAKRAARESGIKLMVHIGDTEKRYDPNVIRELLPIMDEGDILTHYFTANPGGVLDANNKLVPEAKDAADRGVWLDTAHGRMNFSFDVGRRIVDQGLLPHCISTDITVPGRINTVHSMTEMMTRFMGLGFSFEDVVTMCTANPAKAINEQNRIGSLKVGMQADISVLEEKGRRLGSVRHPPGAPQGGQVSRACPHGETRRGVRTGVGTQGRGAGSRTRPKDSCIGVSTSLNGRDNQRKPTGYRFNCTDRPTPVIPAQAGIQEEPSVL